MKDIYTLSTNGLIFKIFENLFIQNFCPRSLIPHPTFSLTAKVRIRRVCNLIVSPENYNERNIQGFGHRSYEGNKIQWSYDSILNIKNATGTLFLL